MGASSTPPTAWPAGRRAWSPIREPSSPYDQIIRLGYQDAVNHDCGGSGCLVLDRPPTRHQLWSEEERQTIAMQTPGGRGRS